ncbi:hypothetical protein [Leifsonia sp. LS-T14]|uniref:hypothetical protein n=1 Tax=unclassified Leifsonia TaxID=2663824 RepID=UPI0035A6ECF6
MWKPTGLGFNTVDPDDSAVYLDPELRHRLDALSPRQLVELDLAMDAVIERVYEDLDKEFKPEDEDRYYMQAPPQSIRLRNVDPSRDLAASLAAQIDGVPLRWRLDIAQSLGSYIRDYGPSQRKYFRILKRIQRESLSAPGLSE